MDSEIDIDPVEPTDSECILLSDSDGIVLWASPSTVAVLHRDPEEIRRTETVQTLLGPRVPEPRHVGSERVTRTLTVTTGGGEPMDLVVTIESESGPAVTIYRCRLVDGQLDVRSVLSRVDDAIVAFDTEWRYTYVNDRAAALLDHSPAELLGVDVWDVFPEAEGTRIHEALARAMATQESQTLEWFWEASEQYFDVRCFPSLSGVSMYFQNLTDRKHREDELRRERDLVEQLLRVSPMGIAVHTPDGRFVRLNERAEELLSADSDELVGAILDEPAWDAYGPDGEPFPDEAFPLNVVLRTGEPTFGTEMSLRRSEGTRFWLSVSAAPLLDEAGEVERVVVAFEDITDRRQYERELEASEQQFRAVFEGTQDALVLADDDGDYLAVNEAACDLYGREEADLVGRNVAAFAPEEHDVAAAWEGFLDTGTVRGEFPLVRPDGEVRTTEFTATADITPGVHLSALRDVTDRKRTERQLAAQRDELRRLNRINELIREVHRTIVGATDRETIRRGVCEKLQSDSYPIAVAARYTPTGKIQVEHAVGLPADRVAALRTAGANCLDDSMRRASTGNTLTVLTGLQTDVDHPAALRELAADHDIRAIGTIPMTYDGTVYGVLTVGARDESAFSEREQSVFLELGQLIGKAIDAIQTKKLLNANAYQELTLAASARDAPLVELHDRLGEPMTVNGVLTVDADHSLLYVTAEAATQSAVEDAVDGLDGIEVVRVAESDYRPLVELRIDDTTALSTLLDTGGRLQTATIADGVGEFVVDVPLDTDVRAYLARVEQHGVDLGLLSKREVERTATAAWGGTTTELTDRQRTVLEAAYRSGYFEWPRRHTSGEELADALGVASSTLHQHLRVATAKVLDSYFDGHVPDVS